MTTYRTPHAALPAFPDFGEALIPGRPAPTPEQYAAECALAAAYVGRFAPDLLDMLGLGGVR